MGAAGSCGVGSGSRMKRVSFSRRAAAVPFLAAALSLSGAPLLSCGDGGTEVPEADGSAPDADALPPPATRTDPAAVHVVGTTFRDGHGRQLLFRGYNAKVTTLFDVTFDDGRVPEETFPDLSRGRDRAHRAARLERAAHPAQLERPRAAAAAVCAGLLRQARRRARHGARARVLRHPRHAPGRVLQGDRRGRRAPLGHHSAAHAAAAGSLRRLAPPHRPGRSTPGSPSSTTTRTRRTGAICKGRTSPPCSSSRVTSWAIPPCSGTRP